MKLKNTMAGILSLLTVVSVCSACGDTAQTQTPAATDAKEADTASVTETTEPDLFADFDYNGEEIRIYTSTNNPGGVGNSNYLIEGPAEETGDVVNDSAYARNRKVEEILNVKLAYTELDNDYTQCGSSISKLILSGEDAYDIIINDLFPLAGLSIEGQFRNIADAPYLDFTQDYWYDNYMTQLSLDGKKMFLLAGDYFIDILRSAHALYFNKNLLASYYDNGDLLYEEVLNGTWTYDKMLTYTSAFYLDLNGDGKTDSADQFGLVVNQIWGPSIPFIISADNEFVTLNEDGTMSLAMNNEHSVTLLEKLNSIFYDAATCNTETLNDGSDALELCLKVFKSGRSLILGYHRLGSFEDLRDMDDEVGILPYPKFDESQENYVTSSHDTTEVGCIPVTCSKFETVCAVLEVLNRETQKLVLPAYYETGLKVKYTRDDLSAQMIDIIHNNIGGSFALAYDNQCNTIFMNGSFYVPLASKKTDFVSNYVKKEKAAQKKLDKLVEQFNAIES